MEDPLSNLKCSLAEELDLGKSQQTQGYFMIRRYNAIFIASPFFTDVDYSIELFVNEGCPKLSLMIDHLYLKLPVFIFPSLVLCVFVFHLLCLARRVSRAGKPHTAIIYSPRYCCYPSYQHHYFVIIIIIIIHYHSLSYYFRFTLLLL